ncbi:hypothetical protein N781_13825 [Pontibacillus halophilus JSM 076056 = DSM 19796]|uniref:Uncharacterized protein n=1 Tax=Pontibacillus halophilus JSM 076056 = DSM 19796 TaxID=1385510 RepID=A0A0A5GII9_9BACI|nr:hypothetical protein N781_13825 [Pontibacillus halophilus JSM 076056 = DSM 19796]
MQNCEIGEYVKLEHSILDKEVVVDHHRMLKGNENNPRVWEKKMMH